MNNFHHMVTELGISTALSTLNNSSANGAAIVEPWQLGRQVIFLLHTGTVAAASVDIKIQGRLRSDGTTWEDLDDAIAATAVIVNADDDVVKMATVRCDAVDTEQYEAIRIVLTETATANAPVGCLHFVTDLYEKPSGTSDLLFSAQVAL